MFRDVSRSAFICLLVFALACFAKITIKVPDNDFELDVTTNGDLSSVSTTAPRVTAANTVISVNIKNGFKNESLDVFWVSNKGDEVNMGEITAFSSMQLNTFFSHVFTARTRISRIRAYPPTFTISPAKKEYVFGPNPSQPLDPNAHLIVPAVSSATASDRNLFLRYINRRSTSISAKFRCLVPNGVDIFYEDGQGGSPQGSLNLGQEYTVNTYEGHVFFFTAKNNKNLEFARVVCTEEQVLYIISDPQHPPAQHFIDHRDKEEAFMREYRNRTGLQWRHFYGPNGARGPPVLPMWPAPTVGHVHRVDSTEGFWQCDGPKSECQSTETISLSLEVISTHPKAFYVPNFLNNLEAEAIISIARPRIEDSFVGNNDGGGARKSSTRTSQNTWIPRDHNYIIETLFKRAEHLLNITRLDRVNTEDLQVVHYNVGQRYDAHHDWGVSGYAESRFITLLLYLSDMEGEHAGGETAFPKAAGGKGMKVHAGKGSAVLFYNLLEDGNGDDLALHAALPVYQGEKWLANFWVWDPKRK